MDEMTPPAVDSADFAIWPPPFAAGAPAEPAAIAGEEDDLWPPRSASEPAAPSPAEAEPALAPGRQARPRLFWVLAGLVVLLLVAGIGLVAYYFYLTRGAGAVAAPPLSAPWRDLKPEDVSPGLAVWTLTGIAPDQFYRQAMASGDMDSAAAEALLNASLPATQRLGWLSVLARRMQAAGRPDLAETLLGVTADLTLAAPGLSDRQRVEALTTAAAGFIPRDRERALALLAQVRLLARFSPEFTPAVRRQILDEAAVVYEAAGDSQSARAARALPAGAPAAALTPSPDPFIPLAGPPPYGDAVAALVTARRQQAQVFVDAWTAGGGQVPRGAAQALADALIDEDLARRAFYAQGLGDAALPASERARVLWDQIEWLALKHRAANGLFGMTLVANWTAEQPAIRQQLHDAFVDLTGALLEHIQTLPAVDQPAARFALYRGVLAWSIVGLYPDADRVFLANALNDARSQWSEAVGVLPQAEIGAGGALRYDLTVAPVQ